MPQLISRDKCTGCSACYNKCGFDALKMVEDNTGFLYPVISKDKCVDCKACEKACPVTNRVFSESITQRAYIAQNIDERIRLQSTSGGVFTSIAIEVIKSGGVVFGAAFDKNYHVRHIYVETEKELSRFRSSKYVQSEIGDSFKQAKEFLLSGRKVCFSGTPCQINGLKSFLGKQYENLVTVDVMCRAVPSPKVFMKYVESQRTKYPGMKRLVFRDKARGYSYSTLSIYDENKSVYRGGSEYDQWLRLFFKGFCNRESCFDCVFQSGNRISDFTLWDCWGTQNHSPEMDDNKGTTNVIVWTQKGQQIFDDIQSLKYKEIGIENIDASLVRGVLPRPNYDKGVFWEDVEYMESNAFLKKYVPISLKVRVKSTLRQIIWKLHLHNMIRKTVHYGRKTIKKFGG